MKKRLAIQPDYQKIQIGEIDNVISKLKTDGTPEERANNISDQLLNSLKSRYLDLSDCQISDEILQDILPLLSILNITSLDLSGNNMGPAGATSLAKTLETNTSITELHLSDNDIGPD